MASLLQPVRRLFGDGKRSPETTGFLGERHHDGAMDIDRLLSSELTVLKRSLEHALDTLDTLDRRPIRATVGDAELRSRLRKRLDDEGIEAGTLPHGTTRAPERARAGRRCGSPA
jgi:hypothetical protein